MADVDLPDSSLRKALEFAVSMAALWSRNGDMVPAAMRPYLRSPRLSAAQLRKVRAVVEADAAFRQRVGATAGGGPVDELGVLWLTRPDGWSAQVAELVGLQPSADDVGLDDVRKEMRRRIAAEDSKARAEQERDAAVGALEAARRSAAVAEDETARVRLDLAGLQRQYDELRNTERRRSAGAKDGEDRVAALESEVASLRMALAEVTEARDRALAARLNQRDSSAELERVQSLLRQALAVVNGDAPGEQRPQRQPLAVPGRFTGDLEGAAEHLFRTERVVVLIDGYNVALHAWSDVPIDQLRERLIVGVDNLVRRWGTRVQIVFDGSHVPGAHATRPRHLHIEFSPPGVKADDVLVDKVAALDHTAPVVVVTNDKELQRRVRRLGANTVASDTLQLLLRR